MTEHTRIKKFFAPLTMGEIGALGLTDDAAILTPPPGAQLVITTDSVIEGVHILSGATPQQFVTKLMRRNLSDLAAMGATPWRYTINIHTPRRMSEDWFALFCNELQREQEQFGLTLIGGDSTSGDGPIHLTMTCFGLLTGPALLRSGAIVGDAIYVSGTLGDAAAALHMLQHHLPCPNELAARYYAPTPRLELAAMLRGVATAAIDISDGLLADLQQLCTASRVGARVEQSALPVSDTLRSIALDSGTLTRFAQSGGDDYELLFTAPLEHRARVEAIATALQLPLTHIGEITAGAELRLLDTQGKPFPITAMGFEHR